MNIKHYNTTKMIYTKDLQSSFKDPKIFPTEFLQKFYNMKV